MEVGKLVGAKIAVDMYSVLRTEIVDRELCQLFFATFHISLARFLKTNINQDVSCHVETVALLSQLK